MAQVYEESEFKKLFTLSILNSIIYFVAGAVIIILGAFWLGDSFKKIPNYATFPIALIGLSWAAAFFNGYLSWNFFNAHYKERPSRKKLIKVLIGGLAIFFLVDFILTPSLTTWGYHYTGIPEAAWANHPGSPFPYGIGIFLYSWSGIPQGLPYYPENILCIIIMAVMLLVTAGFFMLGVKIASKRVKLKVGL